MGGTFALLNKSVNSIMKLKRMFPLSFRFIEDPSKILKLPPERSQTTNGIILLKLKAANHYNLFMISRIKTCFEVWLLMKTAQSISYKKGRPKLITLLFQNIIKWIRNHDIRIHMKIIQNFHRYIWRTKKCYSVIQKMKGKK